MGILVVGGGIAGLSLALNLHRRGISCQVYERAPSIKELGVGITVLPHCMRELAALGVEQEIIQAGISNIESCFFNRFGQLIYREPRGAAGGYAHPEVGIHRGRLHLVLYRAVLARLGSDAVVTDRTCVGVEQSGDEAVAHFIETTTGLASPSLRADAVIACDGVNSAIRQKFYPSEQVAFSGINTWRGVTRRSPILTGRSYLRIGSIRTGKIVIYPIIDNIDGHGAQLINWMAEIETRSTERNDWNQTGRLEDFYPVYQDWNFDWLNVPEMIRSAEQILEYPMVDKDPVDRWTFGRVTFAGDAAHPMYPRGSNGAAQACIDARVLADFLAETREVEPALRAYEAARLSVVNKIVLTNRSNPPDFINIKVEELVGDRPFDDLDRYISQDELRTLSDDYKKIAGFSRDDLSAAGGS